LFGLGSIDADGSGSGSGSDDGGVKTDAETELAFDAKYCRTFTPLTEFDTYLIDGTARNERDAMIVSATNPGLFRFDLNGNIQAGEEVAAAVLELQVAHSARECSSGGNSCDNCPHTAAKWELYWNKTGWNATATSTSGWQQPFATGSNDRSAVLATGPLALSAGVDTLELNVDFAAVRAVPVANWRTTDDISLQLRTSEGAFAVSTLEATTPCDAPRTNKPATLKLILCR
jgi:hypothetical protein